MILSGKLVLTVGSSMGGLVVGRIWLLILRVNNEDSIDILYCGDVRAIV